MTSSVDQTRSSPFHIGATAFKDADSLRTEWMGSWHMAYSNLKMWTDGKKLRANYVYTPIAGGGKEFSDVMRGEEVVDGSIDPPKTKPTAMDGTNKQHEKEPNKFTWRGTGWLRLVTLDWRIVYYNRDAGVAATCFTKTFYSEAGCNIIVRDPHRHAPLEENPVFKEAAAAIKRQPDIADMGPNLEPVAGTRWDSLKRWRK